MYIPLQLFNGYLWFLSSRYIHVSGAENAKYEYTTIKFSISCLLNKSITCYIRDCSWHKGYHSEWGKILPSMELTLKDIRTFFLSALSPSLVRFQKWP